MRMSQATARPGRRAWAALPRVAIRRRGGALAAPSWFVSLVVHVGVLFTFASYMHHPGGSAGSGAFLFEFGFGKEGESGAPGEGSSGPPGPGLPEAPESSFTLGGSKSPPKGLESLPPSPNRSARDEGPPVELDLPVVQAPRPGGGTPYGRGSSFDA